MSIPAVEAFLLSADECDAEYNFDIEDGWTHEATCKRSYTSERLDWVFSHVKRGGVRHFLAARFRRRDG